MACEKCGSHIGSILAVVREALGEIEWANRDVTRDDVDSFTGAHLGKAEGMLKALLVDNEARNTP
jgi:hypothetical protein